MDPQPRNLAQLATALESAWLNIPENTFRDLSDSLPARLAAVRSAKETLHDLRGRIRDPWANVLRSTLQRVQRDIQTIIQMWITTDGEKLEHLKLRNANSAGFQQGKPKGVLFSSHDYSTKPRHHFYEYSSSRSEVKMVARDFVTALSVSFHK
ncbi:transposable element Tcb1 transposase [Trichonephila clavipes]|nr:transposable element Tcb1 transposase [Trichonephila clavipes]